MLYWRRTLFPGTGGVMAEGLPVVLITGTSSGVGLELVKLLREFPYRVVATARACSLHILEERGLVSSDKLLIKELDVCELNSHENLIQEIEAQWGPVDILINNAGISYRGAVEHMSVQDESKQMSVNYLGPMNLIRLVLPRMREHRAGRIINVSSVGGMMAMPTMGSYSASKWALEGASESLWYELRPFGIQVVLVQPGFINSDSFRRVHHPEGYQDATQWGAYRQHYMNMAGFVERIMGRSLSDSQDVARVILKTMRKSRPRLRVAATLDARLFYLLRRFLPRVFYHRFLYECLPGKSKWGRDE